MGPDLITKARCRVVKQRLHGISFIDKLLVHGYEDTLPHHPDCDNCEENQRRSHN
jgi:hypothetical protein